jgi:hypothetical protein
VAALLAAWLATVSASAEGGVFASSPAGGRVRAGEVVPLSWTLGAAETGGHDEMELVLSLDDGATFPVRVVAHLDPTDLDVRWRVPALPTEHARLALRAGEDGSAPSEQIVAVSEPFAITTSRFETLERLYAVSDEWRTRDALEGAPARTDDGSFAPPSPMPEVASGDREKSDSETSPTADLTPATAEHARSIEFADPDRGDGLPISAHRAPVPLRL